MRTILLSLLCFGQIMAATAADTLTIARVESRLIVPTARGRGQIECNLKADYPVGGVAALKTSINEWIEETLGEVVAAESGEGAPVMSAVGNNFIEAANNEVAKAIIPQDRSFGLTLDVRLKREYESSRALTMSLEIQRYGIDSVYTPVNRCMTFVKASGNKLGWGDLFLTDTKSQTRLKNALVKQILRYFGMSNYDDLLSRLSLDPKPVQAKFPLSQLPPALTYGGLRVEYLPGELAEGRTSIIAFIPLGDIKSALTQTAKKLL